jgi:hypothetical protein
VVIAWAIGRAEAEWPLIKTELASLANETQRHYESTFSPLLETVSTGAGNDRRGDDHLTGIERIYEDISAGMDIIESVPQRLLWLSWQKRSL